MPIFGFLIVLNNNYPIMSIVKLLLGLLVHFKENNNLIPKFKSLVNFKKKNTIVSKLKSLVNFKKKNYRMSTLKS